MLVITKQDRERRMEELEKPRVERLLKEAKTDKTKVHILQSKYGMEGDYIPGYDDGEGPRQ